MSRRFYAILVLAGMVMTLALAGCSVDTELSGTPIPNSRPDTRVTGQPPTLLEAGFIVQFNWTGSDVDGLIQGFEYKISDNGLDGISPRDTMTIDPLTGAELNPWFYTEATDSLFYVLADQPNFPGDPEDGYGRSFRTHTLWIRAIDDDGAIDPTPAQISFTSTTLVPKAYARYPSVDETAVFVPTTVNMGYEGEDPDFDLRVPSKVRFLLVPGYTEDGFAINTRNRYNSYFEELIDFQDPDWTAWVPYEIQEEDRRITYSDRPPGELFLFAVQVQDTAGAVSVGRGYGQEVFNMEIDDSGQRFKPGSNVDEVFLGSTQSEYKESEIAAGQPLNFSWSADASHYNGRVISFRHGWDVADMEDTGDPGWAVPPGLSEQNRFAEERSFQEGDHTFCLRIEDDSNNVKNFVWKIRVIPFINRNFQSELLLVDQTVDNQTGAWQGQGGSPAYDSENYRDPYWRFLEGENGVSGFSWDEDHKGHTDLLTYSELVWYKACLMHARFSSSQLIIDNFRPVNGQDKYVWMAPYQERGGNLFLVGARSMDSFLEPLANYMVPIIFDTNEENYVVNGEAFVVGFGTKEKPDGTEVDRGPLLYPYATAGIAALDWAVPLNKFIYGSRLTGSSERRSACAGLKAVVLDQDFKENHGLGVGAIADTIYTNPLIDWRDIYQAGADTLDRPFEFGAEEFVDYNISTRSTNINLQLCEENEFTGLCVEPMFRGLARFDWVRERRYAEGDYDWPDSTYSNDRIIDICGRKALTSYVREEDGVVVGNGSARTNGLVFGYRSYKTVVDKPGGKPDVYWGFDPYRFDSDETKKAILWVLEEFGLLTNQ